MMNRKTSNEQRGFTIVELMVSTIIFSLIMLGAMAALIQIGQLYYRGITISRTQETTRAAIGEISQTAQFSRDQITLGGPTGAGPEFALGATDNRSAFCIGPRRYSYILDRKLRQAPDGSRKDSRHVLWVDEPVTTCDPTSIADLDADDPCGDGSCTNGRELISDNVRISKLELVPNGQLVSISLSLAHGDDDTEDDGPLTTESGRRVCNTTSSISQFCAISELSSTVQRRL